MELIIVTGMSGAGKSKAVNALEDSGYYCVDNLPAEFLQDFCRMRRRESIKTAIVIDARSKKIALLAQSLRELRDAGTKFRLLFLDASQEVLLQRFKETRRRHPLLDETGGLPSAIELEREMLKPVHDMADYLLDTSLLSPAQCRSRIIEMLCGGENSPAMLVQCISFGFRYGLPQDADLVFDVRCLPNPYYIPELREHTGTESCVRDYVMQHEQSRIFLDKLCDLLDFLMPMYIAEGKSQLVIATGCTGGHHRSVTMAEELGGYLRSKGYHTLITHRDKDKVVQK